MVTSDPLQGSNSVPRWSVFSQIHSTQSLMLVLSQKLSGCPRRSGRPDGGQAVPSTPSIPEPSGPHPGCSCRASGGGGGEQRGPPARPGEVWGLERAQMESPENGGTVGRKKGVELPAQAQ